MREQALQVFGGGTFADEGIGSEARKALACPRNTNEVCVSKSEVVGDEFRELAREESHVEAGKPYMPCFLLECL